VKNLFDNYQLPNDKSSNKKNLDLPIASVDKIADELATEYANQDYRRWYCGVIYEFGFSKVNEWRRRASKGREPAKLFSRYVRDARVYHGASRTRM